MPDRSDRFYELFQAVPVACWEETLEPQRSLPSLTEELDSNMAVPYREVLSLNAAAIELFGSREGSELTTRVSSALGELPLDTLRGLNAGWEGGECITAHLRIGTPCEPFQSFDVRWTALDDENGEQRFLVTAIPIPAVEDCREKSLALNLLPESSVVGSWIRRAEDGCFLACSRTLQILGVSVASREALDESQLLNRVVAEDKERVRRELLAVVDGHELLAPREPREVVTIAFRVAGLDGQLHRVLFLLEPVGDPESVSLVGVTIDLSEQRRLAQAEEEKRESVSTSERMAAVGSLVSGLSHEINNPTHLISLNAPLLREVWSDLLPILDQHEARSPGLELASIPYQDLRSEFLEIVDEITKGADRIAAMLTELQDFSTAGGCDVMDRISINEVLRGAVQQLEGSIEEATESFEVCYSDGLPPVEGHRQRLEQVIMNLLVNSCQALSSRRDRIFVGSEWLEEEGVVCLVVRDEGHGIEPETLPCVTEPFFTTRRAEGCKGLGLAAASSIVDEHRGSLEICSELGRGTEVRVSLPIFGETMA